MGGGEEEGEEEKRGRGKITEGKWLGNFICTASLVDYQNYPVVV